MCSTIALLLVGCAGKALAPPARSPTVPPPIVGPSPRVFLHAPTALAQRKAEWRARPKHAAVERLLREADQALAVAPFSITEKSELPPSGDKHDYLSLAPYAWRNPSTPDGLPYVIRDGRTNPERDTIADHRDFARIVDLGETLGLATFFTDDDRYAAHAARLLRAFFLDPATRMNPNLRFAQIVRGKQEARPAGIIDTAGIARLVDAVGLLDGSPSWSRADQQGMTDWFRAYLQWLRESEQGVHEGQAKNNHGAWYDVQVVSLALATGESEAAREVLQFARKRRIGRAVEPDGSLPAELARTRSWHYAVYHLTALVALADLGDAAGIDLWHYQTPDGRAIRKAIDWLVPFAVGDQPWATPELGGFAPTELVPCLREAAARLPAPDLAAAAQRIGGRPDDRAELFVSGTP